MERFLFRILFMFQNIFNGLGSSRPLGSASLLSGRDRVIRLYTYLPKKRRKVLRLYVSAHVLPRPARICISLLPLAPHALRLQGLPVRLHPSGNMSSQTKDQKSIFNPIVKLLTIGLAPVCIPKLLGPNSPKKPVNLVSTPSGLKDV